MAFCAPSTNLATCQVTRTAGPSTNYMNLPGTYTFDYIEVVDWWDNSAKYFSGGTVHGDDLHETTHGLNMPDLTVDFD